MALSFKNIYLFFSKSWRKLGKTFSEPIFIPIKRLHFQNPTFFIYYGYFGKTPTWISSTIFFLSNKRKLDLSGVCLLSYPWCFCVVVKRVTLKLIFYSLLAFFFNTWNYLLWILSTTKPILVIFSIVPIFFLSLSCSKSSYCMMVLVSPK